MPQPQLVPSGMHDPSPLCTYTCTRRVHSVLVSRIAIWHTRVPVLEYGLDDSVLVFNGAHNSGPTGSSTSTRVHVYTPVRPLLLCSNRCSTISIYYQLGHPCLCIFNQRHCIGVGEQTTTLVKVSPGIFLPRVEYMTLCTDFGHPIVLTCSTPAFYSF